jgi:penicillin-binding protein 1A
MITGVDDRNGKVLEAFQDNSSETAMSTPVAQTLIDVMRGVIDQGTGTGIRSRYGIRADVAGKTGTTQDNTDGWFILMHPQLVAGAWVGFNDNRVTMGSRWGQGAQSALPIVGEFYRLAIKAKVVDQNMHFLAPRMSVPALQAEPSADSQIDASGQPLPASGAPLEPLTPKMVRAPAIDAGTAPEGSWQPSPGARNMAVPVPLPDFPKTDATVPTFTGPRDVQLPDRR